MAKQILVPIIGSDSIEQLLPYIEKVAQPGMKVVFYVHCSVKNFKPLIEALLAVHTGIIDPSILSGNASRNVFEDKKDALKREVLSTCERLIERGIEIGVIVYNVGAKRIMRDCMANEDVHLVIMRPKANNFLRAVLRALGPLARFLQSPLCSSVVLLLPEHTTRR
jgi:hypothetical protein